MNWICMISTLAIVFLGVGVFLALFCNDLMMILWPVRLLLIAGRVGMKLMDWLHHKRVERHHARIRTAFDDRFWLAWAISAPSDRAINF